MCCCAVRSAQEKGTFTCEKDQQCTVLLNPQGTFKLNKVQHIGKKTRPLKLRNPTYMLEAAMPVTYNKMLPMETGEQKIGENLNST